MDEISDQFNVYHILSNRRRTIVITYLSLFQQGESIEVRHLARVVRAIETGTAPRNVPATGYESAYNSLIQTHLPRLNVPKIIEYDEQRKVVATTPKLHQLAAVAALNQMLIPEL